MRMLTLLPSFLPPAPASRDATATAERPGTTTGKCGHAALPVGGAGRAGKGRRRP